MRKSYPSDLSDPEWSIIEPFFRTNPSKGGRPPLHPKREIVNAIYYVLRTGIQWCYLPHEFPPWQTVYNHLRDWENLGIWEKINRELTKRWRAKTGRPESPTAATADSQTIKTTVRGVLKVTMEEKRSRGERGIFSWTLKGSCYRPK